MNATKCAMWPGKKPWPSPEELISIPYVELLALIGKSNRPVGGMDTIRQLIINTHLRPGLDVLHCGSSSGFLSRELARRSGCQVTGIDKSESMVALATQRARHEGLSHLVRYEMADMRRLPFPGEVFDAVICGGALAFVNEKEQAIKEWIRVTKPHGLVADAQWYYRAAPPTEVLSGVSQAIGVRLTNWDRDYWRKLFRHPLLEAYYGHEGAAPTASDDEIERYCLEMVEWGGKELPAAYRAALFERLWAMYSLFNDNLRYMNYQILIFKRLPINPEPCLYH